MASNVANHETRSKPSERSGRSGLVHVSIPLAAVLSALREKQPREPKKRK